MLRSKSLRPLLLIVYTHQLFLTGVIRKRSNFHSVLQWSSHKLNFLAAGKKSSEKNTSYLSAVTLEGVCSSYGTQATKLLQGKPLTRQVNAALEKKHVICFIKYYDQNYRGIGQRCYPLMKIYTEIEVHEYELAQQTSALAASLSQELTPAAQIGSSSSAPQHVAGKPQQASALAPNLSEELTPAACIESSLSTPQHVPEKQLFTPTIKIVLEEVGKVAASASTHLHEQIGAKRALAFEAPETDKDTNPPTTQDTYGLPPPSTTDSTSSNRAPIQQKPHQQRRLGTKTRRSDISDSGYQMQINFERYLQIMNYSTMANNNILHH